MFNSVNLNLRKQQPRSQGSLLPAPTERERERPWKTLVHGLSLARSVGRVGENPGNEVEKAADISRRHHWFPCEMTSENRNECRNSVQYWWRVTKQIWIVLLIGWSQFPTRHDQSEALPRSWVVTCHQYGISALVSQTSFAGETSGSVAKCRLFSQATLVWMRSRTFIRKNGLKPKIQRFNELQTLILVLVLVRTYICEWRRKENVFSLQPTGSL